ncbi:hypothetical protein [Homoserinibacter sp. GY 40078]|uniref:hypothetical protein n=1 Tax=Homoserinibacter sp. GY 40078 TaxID=2603275 RepID=UPI0011C6F984|nr:hypothetical protein [Homoserinibacter sp. GY 40078]TXK19226.1 hypothetical protein FVQ89_04750 [Homoserinibacter sp. GY 40078]
MSTVLLLRALRTDDRGHAAPTPLFLAFLGALVLAAAFAFRTGFDASTVRDFLLLASIVSGCVLLAFVGIMVWATRAGHRAAVLSASRPGAVVIRAMRSRGLASAAAGMASGRRVLPIGITLVADDGGIEVWGGPAEEPVRIARAPWQSVQAIRVGRVNRAGRASDGLLFTVGIAADGGVELPVAVVGTGLGGLSSLTPAALERLAGGLEARRVAAMRV